MCNLGLNPVQQRSSYNSVSLTNNDVQCDVVVAESLPAHTSLTSCGIALVLQIMGLSKFGQTDQTLVYNSVRKMTADMPSFKEC